jgi:Ca-activated chloride channel family protein
MDRRRTIVRKWALALLAGVLGCSTNVGVALADGMILPETLNAGYLGVRYHRVEVSIEDNHAVTRVEQAFHNPYDFHMDGQYLFPVPPDAILSDFQATVDGQAQEPVRQDSATTNAALHTAVEQQRDSSLLRYVDWESLAFDLSLPPGASCRVDLAYEEVLAPVGGMYRYHYTLSTERYSSQPLEEVSLTVDIHSSAGLANVYSPSHDVTVERPESGPTRASWEAQQVLPMDDFELFFAPADGGFGAGLLTDQRDGDDHFLFTFSPESELAPHSILPKDIVFVMDRSGSMGGEKIEQARDALHFVLGQLDENDRFSIVSFNHELMTLAQTLQPVTADVLANARRYVDRLTAAGDTDLEAALQTGLQALAASEHRAAAHIVVFLTDGLPTAGVTDYTLIAERVAQANAEADNRLHVFGVGYDVNTHLLDRLAADNRGTVTYVQPGEDLETALTEFYSHIAHPVLTDVSVEFEGLEVSQLYPETMPDLFQGSTLMLTGSYRATSEVVAVRVRGRAGAEEREYAYRFDLSQTGDYDFVSRLWATRRVGALLDRVRVEGENEELKEEIRELGLEYGLVTPYTTFVIEGQASGAASQENMALYDDRAYLSQVSGETTVRARVQNLAYQNAGQASLAAGANTFQYAGSSVAQISTASADDSTQMSGLNVDLSLLQGQEGLADPITLEWIESNVGVDRIVTFGSDEYFALAADPVARSFLQSGRNAVFAYHGEVILVQDAQTPADASDAGQDAAIQISEEAANDPQAELTGPASPQSVSAAEPTRDATLSPARYLAIAGALAVVTVLLAKGKRAA